MRTYVIIILQKELLMKEMQYIPDYGENNSRYNILAFKLQFRFISFFGIRGFVWLTGSVNHAMS